MNEVPRKKLAIYLIVSTLTITFTFYAYQMIYTPNILVDRDSKLLIIRSGATFRDVQLDLGNGGFVNDMVTFSFLARLMGYDREIRPGRFYMERNMSNLQAIKQLKSGYQKKVNITFNNVRLRSDLPGRGC